MVVVALLSVDLVESVDLVSVYLVVNCISMPYFAKLVALCYLPLAWSVLPGVDYGLSRAMHCQIQPATTALLNACTAKAAKRGP